MPEYVKRYVKEEAQGTEVPQPLVAPQQPQAQPGTQVVTYRDVVTHYVYNISRTYVEAAEHPQATRLASIWPPIFSTTFPVRLWRVTKTSRLPETGARIFIQAAYLRVKEEGIPAALRAISVANDLMTRGYATAIVVGIPKPAVRHDRHGVPVAKVRWVVGIVVDAKYKTVRPRGKSKPYQYLLFRVPDHFATTLKSKTDYTAYAYVLQGPPIVQLGLGRGQPNVPTGPGQSLGPAWGSQSA